jgi:hypothetical protein
MRAPKRRLARNQRKTRGRCSSPAGCRAPPSRGDRARRGRRRVHRRVASEPVPASTPDRSKRPANPPARDAEPRWGACRGPGLRRGRGHAGRSLAERGVGLVAAADSRGAVANPDGLDVTRLIAFEQNGGSLRELLSPTPAASSAPRSSTGAAPRRRRSRRSRDGPRRHRRRAHRARDGGLPPRAAAEALARERIVEAAGYRRCRGESPSPGRRPGARPPRARRSPPAAGRRPRPASAVFPP